MRLGYDAQAAAAARRQVIAFLATHGLAPCPVGQAAQKDERLAAAAAEFRERRDRCDHFRGEEAYDEQRRSVLARNLKRYCTGTDKELASLKAKYKSNGTVTQSAGSVRRCDRAYRRTSRRA